jgi:aromatic ring-opening dioxygenase catalytic subunit (LigB family)
MSRESGKVVYLSHGGGPLPLLGDQGHLKMVAFMKQLSQRLTKPESIIVFSAHWEENVPTLIGSNNPNLYYDYYGFPEEAYSIDYYLPGNPILFEKIINLFAIKQMSIKIDRKRGFDHGVFIPLALMYPEGNIPTIQISLVKGLDPRIHIELGRIIQGILNENVLVIGSGFSFHNMNEFNMNGVINKDEKNDAFQERLISYCTEEMFITDRDQKIIGWESMPYARYCHPREEHLTPLHVCLGMAQKAGELVFDDYILGKRSIAFLWE